MWKILHDEYIARVKKKMEKERIGSKRLKRTAEIKVRPRF